MSQATIKAHKDWWSGQFEELNMTTQHKGRCDDRGLFGTPSIKSEASRVEGSSLQRRAQIQWQQRLQYGNPTVNYYQMGSKNKYKIERPDSVLQYLQSICPHAVMQTIKLLYFTHHQCLMACVLASKRFTTYRGSKQVKSSGKCENKAISHCSHIKKHWRRSLDTPPTGKRTARILLATSCAAVACQTARLTSLQVEKLHAHCALFTSQP